MIGMVAARKDSHAMEFLSRHRIEVCRKKLRQKAPFTPPLLTRIGLSPFRSE